MRYSIMAAVLLALTTASARSEDAPASAPGPSDMTVIKTLGTDLRTMYSLVGQPSDITPKRGDTESEDVVILDYDTFLLEFRGKVRGGFFWKTWKGPILGIRIGDSRKTVAKVLGDAHEDFRNKEGVVTSYGYKLKDLGIEFFANFDDDGKVRRAEFVPLE